MFAKIYSYTIKTEDFEKWRGITAEANAIYLDNGVLDIKQLYRQQGDTMDITEINFYTSKEHCKKLSKELDSNPRIKELYEQFLALVVGKDIKQEDFEVVEN